MIANDSRFLCWKESTTVQSSGSVEGYFHQFHTSKLVYCTWTASVLLSHLDNAYRAGLGGWVLYQQHHDLKGQRMQTEVCCCSIIYCCLHVPLWRQKPCKPDTVKHVACLPGWIVRHDLIPLASDRRKFSWLVEKVFLAGSESLRLRFREKVEWERDFSGPLMSSCLTAMSNYSSDITRVSNLSHGDQYLYKKPAILTEGAVYQLGQPD